MSLFVTFFYFGARDLFSSFRGFFLPRNFPESGIIQFVWRFFCLVVTARQQRRPMGRPSRAKLPRRCAPRNDGCGGSVGGV